MTNKTADTLYPVEELLRERWSPLAFSEELVETDKLCTVLEAAGWAASSYNEQPWSFIVATKDNPVEFQRLLDCLVEGNQEWAKNVPVLMISVAKLNFERNGAENRHAFHDVGAATTTLAIQAMALGLFIHQMAGFDVAKAKEVYSIPDGYEPVAAIALGYLGDPQTLSEKLQQRELALRSRKPLETYVFSGSWNQVSPVINSQD
ncbi:MULTISPECIES: nitroreductase family protein [unclassified Tolypothrix]|uniref:nitroreductase family protein n=1 Tax=unclassified Tolypothrix TaxID=2649714 RepID=UPI0005F78106|nr:MULTISPECIES: nitroreductase family protein [unclassified Tolypothrix]MBE9085061.1 nitroreductase family protein [Tolypothrix sp. LEGE 11397]UYD23841.1 nitroreductase family protein [Tolypothrix sp. PCC 7712]UYD33934.1 nitroreductase family protein [Tolypothrix sp. PCC 7601]